MKMEKTRVVLFASGDFPVPTLKTLLDEASIDVCGVVTSNDKTVFNDKRISEIAVDHGLPCMMPNDLRDERFMKWLKGLKADVFLVISYKYLPKCVLDCCRGCSYNVHASILPFLRGAAPINWAIRLGFKETGLTLFKLDERIDHGKIVFTRKWIIDERETYGTLHQKLSIGCAEFCLDFFASKQYALARNIDGCCQCDIPLFFDSLIFHAPKLTSKNMSLTVGKFTSAFDFDATIRSLSPNIGGRLTMQLYTKSDTENDSNLTISDTENDSNLTISSTFAIKIYETELVDGYFHTNYDLGNVWTDWKDKFYICNPLWLGECVSVKRIQLSCKRVLTIEDFLKGFQVFRGKTDAIEIQ